MRNGTPETFPTKVARGYIPLIKLQPDYVLHVLTTDNKGAVVVHLCSSSVPSAGQPTDRSRVVITVKVFFFFFGNSVWTISCLPHSFFWPRYDLMFVCGCGFYSERGTENPLPIPITQATCTSSLWRLALTVGGYKEKSLSEFENECSFFGMGVCHCLDRELNLCTPFYYCIFDLCLKLAFFIFVCLNCFCCKMFSNFHHLETRC